MGKYYLAVFSEETWNIFLQASNKQYATKLTKESRARRINKGDFFLCYVTKKSAIVGLLEIVSEAYIGESNIYGDSDLPVCLDCEAVICHSVEDGIPIKKIMDKISFLQNVRNTKKWATFFWNPLNEFPERDAEILIQYLRQ